MRELDITPEPTEEERAAIAAALEPEFEPEAVPPPAWFTESSHDEP